MMLERKDMEALADARLQELIANPPQHVLEHAVRMTSGTTGSPIVTAFVSSPAALEPLKHADNILVTIGSLSTRLGVVVLARRLPRPARVLVLSNADLTEATMQLLSQFGPDTVSGSPTFAARAGQLMETHTAKQVQQVSVRGEYLSEALATVLTSRFSLAAIDTLYIANETGAIASAACRPSPLTYYHTLPGVDVEIYQPDESGAGEILVTKHEKDIQIERYHIGDMGRLLPEPCVMCGKKILELLGRQGGDYIKCAGAVVRREELDRVAALMGRHFQDFRAEVGEIADGSSIKGKLLLRIYSRAGVGTPAIAAEIAHTFAKEIFLTPTQTLSQLVEKGVFLPLEVLYVEAPFPQKNKDVKLSRLQ
jgi:phenylacetate-coenzyme A ligase PaaK-like adenylate-forming protein